MTRLGGGAVYVRAKTEWKTVRVKYIHFFNITLDAYLSLLAHPFCAMLVCA